MEPKGSSPCSQNSHTGSYPKPVKSSSAMYFCKIRFNITLPSAQMSLKWSLCKFFDNYSVYIYHFPIHAACSTHLLYVISETFGEQYKLRSASLYNCLQSFVNTCFLYPNIFFCTLFPDTLNPFSPFRVRDQVSRSYKPKIRLSFYICENDEDTVASESR